MSVNEKGSSAVLLHVCTVSKWFGAYRALSEVSLDIGEGEVVALLGPNGAGKTTLSALVASVHQPTEGIIYYKGKDILEDLLTYRRQVGYCPQRTHGDHIFTVRGLLQNAGRYFGMSRVEIEDAIRIVVVVCMIEDVLDRFPSELSGGYRQRVALARALIHQPRLVIMDEPTVALDPHVRRQIWELIRGLKSQGVSVLLTTHYLDEAEHLADRVCFLDRGRVKRFETPAELRVTYGIARLEDIFLRMVTEAEAV